MRSLNRKGQKGFTLIEIIVAIVVGAIVTAIMYPYFGRALTGSSIPLARLRTTLNLQQVLENITADYEASGKTTSNLDALQTAVGAEGADMNNDYGQYSVIHNRFIKFVGNSETPISTGEPHETLKVSIENEMGEILTVLYTAQ